MFKLKTKDVLYYVSDTAIIEENVEIGDYTRIWNFTHVMDGAKIGVSCNIRDGVFVGTKVIIGNNVHIANGVNIPEGVIIKDNVFIGTNVSFKNVKYPRAYRKANEYVPTIVEENATIDANVCLMPGVVVGKNSTVGAGAIVVKSVPEGGFVVSPPAQCICEKETCPECEKRKQKRLLKQQKYEQSKV